MASSRPRPLFVVAIDFGTTYSGYAYSIKDDFETNPAKVFANQTWHAQGQGLLSKKTPTCLLLNPEEKFCAFGYEAEEEYAQLTATNDDYEDWYYFRRFKMTLHGEEDIEDGLMIEDQTGKPLPALTVFSESIAYLVRTFREELDSKDIDIKSHEINWVLTVPAIWNDSSKRFMRKAAVRGGIKSKQLKIALEPEAASIFCQYEKIEKGGATGFCAAIPGTKYMVIDLGGGTVDMAVHEKLRDGKVKEIHKASGGPWGGIAVDEAYIQLLTRIVGGPTMHRFRKETMYDYLDMMREFEVTKRSIKPNGRVMNNFKIPAKLNDICEELNGEDIDAIVKSENFPFRGKIKVFADKLCISHEIIKHIFQTVIDQIIDHMDEIIKHKNVSGLSSILLVGGFAESSLVQEAIKSKYKTEERRVIVPQEPGLSVVKGAVIFGHKDDSIESRILRYTYGIAKETAFNPKQHPKSRKIARKSGPRIRFFEPFIHAGTEIDKGSVVEEDGYYLASEFDTESIFSVFVTSNPNTKYPDDPKCRLLKEIPVGHLLPPLENQDRDCIVNFIFGDTEVEIVLKEEATRFEYNDKFDLEE